MERVLSWLNQPLFPDTVIRVWMAVAAGAALLLALILAFFLIRRKKKKKRGDQAVEEPITERPEPLPELELANLQGVGSREEQQDAFGISRMDRYEEDGLLAVLCDGMGTGAGAKADAEEAISLLRAMITAGFIGFGMGATSNAMANMQAVARRYGPSPSAYFMIPMVGGLFNDFFNAAIIALSIGLLS